MMQDYLKVKKKQNNDTTVIDSLGSQLYTVSLSFY